MKKIKFLILALLGITIIPTATNAYTLRVFDTNEYGNALTHGEKRYFSFCRGNYKVHLPRFGQPEGCYYKYNGNYYPDYGGGNAFYFQPGNVYYGLFPIKSGEGNIFYYANYVNKGDYYEQTIRNLVIPSTTAYEYDGVVYDEIYFYTNTFWFRSSANGDTLQYIGKNRIKNLVVLANPFVSEDNLFFIDFRGKKAWANNLTPQELEKYFLGNFNEEDMKRQKFVSYYSVSPGGNTIFPFILGGGIQDLQGRGVGNGYVYTLEDYEGPNWQSNSNSNKGNQTNSAEAHRECINYYTRMHNLARFSDKCSGNGYDDQAMENFLAVKNWNGEGEKPQLTGSSAWICGVYADKKKKYKELYKEQRVDFEKEFNEFMFSPDALIPANKCKFLEVKEQKEDKDSIVKSLKDFFSSPIEYLKEFRDKFNGYDGKPIGVFSGQNYYNYDFQADSSKLKMYYDECYSTDLIYQVLTEIDRQNSCQKYQQMKSKMELIYGSLTGANFSSGFNSFIKKIEKEKSNDAVGLGKQFLSVFTDPFYSGYNAIDWVPANCSGQKNTFFEPFLYLVFAVIVLYLLKIM